MLNVSTRALRRALAPIASSQTRSIQTTSLSANTSRQGLEVIHDFVSEAEAAALLE